MKPFHSPIYRIEVVRTSRCSYAEQFESISVVATYRHPDNCDAATNDQPARDPLLLLGPSS
jgi:hypothetical protein